MIKHKYDDIPGTIVFDGWQAMKGYPLNKMCFSFNSAVNREAFRRDEDAYCEKFNLTAQQRRAVKHRDVLEMLRDGSFRAKRSAHKRKPITAGQPWLPVSPGRRSSSSRKKRPTAGVMPSVAK